MKFLIFLLLAQVALADVPLNVPFKSRTDLLPASLNVTVNQKEYVSDGYIFIAPGTPLGIAGVPSMMGPHIFDSQGNLVWTGFGTIPNINANFMPGKYKGQQMLTMFEGSPGPEVAVGVGTYTMLNNRYQQVRQYGLKSQYSGDYHEFQPGYCTAVHTSYVPVPYNLSEYSSSLSQTEGWVMNDKAVDIDMETYDVIFEWNSLEHVPLSESMVLDRLTMSGNSSTNVFDYFHMNSVVKDEYGNYLISARYCWALYYVDGQSGKILWAINNGNGPNNWHIDDDATFAFQHHARWLPSRMIGKFEEPNVRYLTLFDNEANDQGARAFRNYSRGIILRLEKYQENRRSVVGRVSLVKEYVLENPLKPSISQGSMQVLDNGNVFINWGWNGEISEHDFETGQVVFRAVINDNRKGSYRGFKSPFEAYPISSPSIVSHLYENNSTTIIYVSWNGATEVSGYRLFGSQDNIYYFGIGDIKKTGFEDSLERNIPYKWVRVKAMAKDGSVLGEYSTKSIIIKA